MDRRSSSVAERVVELMDSLPAGERRAAQTLISNYPVVGMKTVAEFAAQAEVSSPTILRFIARLGFGQYSEFQASLQDELAAQLQSPLSRRETSGTGAKDSLAETVIDNIRETFGHISESQLRSVAKLLADPRARIYLAGGRFTEPLAHYMAAHLILMRSDVIHLPGQESVWRGRLVDIGKRDVVILFDIRRYQDSIVHFAEQAKARGATVILLTDQWLSPAAKFARHVLAGRTAVPSPWDSSASLFVLVEATIAATTTALGAAGAERMTEIERLR